MKKLGLLAVFAMATVPAWAVDSVDLKLIGKVRPAACTPSLDAGGTVDYGDISASTLTPGAYTVLPEKQINFSITCPALTKVAFDLIAGRPGTVAGEDTEIDGFMISPVRLLGWVLGQSSKVSGIGLDVSNNKIGGMAMDIKQGASLVDGITDVNLLVGVRSGFIKKPDTTLLEHRGIYSYSWAVIGSNLPIAFTTITSQMLVQAYLNKPELLDLNHEMTLDGLVTFELEYL